MTCLRAGADQLPAGPRTRSGWTLWRRLALIASVALLSLTGWILLPRGSGLAAPSAGNTNGAGPGQAEHHVEPESRRALVRADAERLLAPATPAPASASPVEIHGRVLDLQSGLGLADHEVVVRLPAVAIAGDEQQTDAAAGKDVGRLRARTDSTGAFVLQAPRPLLPYVVAYASVLDRQQEFVFAGHVQIADGMILVVQPPCLLHGVVTGVDALCEGAVGFALLQERPMVGPIVHSLGRGTLDAAGAFAVRARIAWPDAPVRVKLGCGGHVYVLETDVATITSSEGFHGSVAVKRCRVRVSTSDRTPLADVTIVAAPRGSSTNGTSIQRVTGADGESVLPVPAEGLEIAAAKAGLRTVMTFVAGDAVPPLLELTMAPLEPLDFIAGRVLSASGGPVAGAVVTALPAATAETVEAVAPAQTRTDGRGLFRLQLGGPDVEFDVTAFHKLHGISDNTRVRPHGQSIDLLVPGVRPLLVNASAPGTDERSRGGDVQWFLVEIDGRRVYGGSSALPFETEPLPRGDYNLMLFWPDMDLFGQARATIGDAVSGTPDEVVVLLEPAIWFEGQVVGADARGLRVAHRNPTWPEVTVRFWATARCDADGKFRVLAGNRTSGTLEVLAPDDKTLARIATEWGHMAQIQLHR